MNTPRKLVLIALAIHFISLFLPYKDADRSMSPVTINNIDFYGTIPEVRGMELKPYAFYIIIGLFIVFVTSLADKPFWKKYGYWMAFILLLFFAFGGAIIRTSGGILSLISLFLVLVAAIKNNKQREVKL